MVLHYALNLYACVERLDDGAYIATLSDVPGFEEEGDTAREAVDRLSEVVRQRLLED